MLKCGQIEMGDEKFMQLLGSTTVTHVQTTESDQCALIIDI